MNNKIGHIIWDWNGTLLDDRQLEVDIISRMLVKRGLKPVSVELHLETFRFPVSDYLLLHGIDAQKEGPQNVGQEFMSLYREAKYSAALQPEATKVLQALKQAGKQHSILSAYPQDELLLDVEYFGISNFFEHILGHENLYPVSKTNNGRRLLDALKIPKEKVLIVGDIVHDFEVAKELGLNCVLVSTGHNSKAVLSRCDAPLANSLREVFEIVEGRPL